MNRSSFLSAITALLFPGMLNATEEPVLFTAEATETITITFDAESSAAQTYQTNVNFHKLYQMMPEEREFIAKETIGRKFLESTDGEIATARVDLYYRQGDGTFSPEPDHTTTAPEVSDVKFKADHWTGTIVGCCDAEPYTELFAYGQDKPFLRCNGKYAEAVLPNAGLTRYVGVVLRVQVPTDAAEKAIFGRNKKAKAAVLYAAPGRPLQKLLIQPKDGLGEDEFPYHTLDVDLKSDSPKDEDGYNEDPALSKVVTMWSQDTVPGQKQATSISGLTIIASFSGNDGDIEKVSIPVTNDKFGKAIATGRTLQIGQISE